MKVENLTVTSINDLVRYSEGSIVELPSFGEGQRFVAKLKRPSMLMLAKTGKIPNELLYSATSLFSGNSKELNDNVHMLEEVYDISRIICEASLIEPTLAEIESAGLSLTDEQIMAIFNYAQQGVKALKDFRTE